MITTNGTLINQKVADELASNKVFLINISLDGFRPQTHDKLRGVQGAYMKIMQAIEYLKGRVPLQINTTVMDENLDEILDLAGFAQKNGVMISFQPYNNMIYRLKGSDGPVKQDFTPRDINKIDHIIGELCRLKKYNKSIIDSYAQLNRMKDYYNGLLGDKKRIVKPFV